jgi:hypothetical protein
MNLPRYLPVVVLGASMSFGTVFAMCGCASTDDNRAIPGTLQSTDSKNSENNTPQTNPTPNPEPASNPPGAASDYRPVVQ